METKMLASCSSCGCTKEITAYGGINVGERPELKSRVKDGSLFVWECPSCGAANLAAYQTIYHDPNERILIWLLPEGTIPEAQVEAIGRQIEASSDFPEGYVFRRVGDVGSLIEKVNIFDAGLDDTVMELCKYVTKMGMSEKDPGKAISGASLKFYRTDGPDNDIEFSYPADGSMQGLRIGFNVYGDCAGILRRNPSMKPSPGFSVVDQAWIARFFR